MLQVVGAIVFIVLAYTVLAPAALPGRCMVGVRAEAEGRAT
jgi:hypothetical protein